MLFAVSILIHSMSFTQTTTPQHVRDSLRKADAFATIDRCFQRIAAEEQKRARQQQILDSVKYFHLDVDVLNTYIFTEVNLVRKAAGKPEFVLFNDDTLTARCKRFANYLVVNNLIGHEGKDYRAENVAGQIADLADDLKFDDRNAMYTHIAKLFVDQWMNSFNHKTILLSTAYSKIIIGTAKKYTSNFYFTLGTMPSGTISPIGWELRSVIRFY